MDVQIFIASPSWLRDTGYEEEVTFSQMHRDGTVSRSSFEFTQIQVMIETTQPGTEIGRETTGSKQVIQFHCFWFEK